jgi:hypothetical protein
MADTATLIGRPPPQPACVRCHAHDQAVPLEAQLHILASEDLQLAELTFRPRPMNLKQAVAAEVLTSALWKFVDAFGLDTAGARMACMVDVLRHQAKYSLVSRRILEARADINRRALEAELFYDGGSALDVEERIAAILTEPTPDYPGKAKDDAWMRETGV